MQKPQPEPEQRCACGRERSEAAEAVYRSEAVVFVFHRCTCGVEWTERRDGIDRNQPVTTDEVIEVHQALAGFEGPISELLGLHPA